MRHLFAAFSTLIIQLSFANMASPIREGTLSSSAFSSKNIDILKEKILISVDSQFNTALFSVEYSIKTDSEGRQIPLLFHATDYNGQFKVWVDDKEITILPIPNDYLEIPNSLFHNFSHIFHGSNQVTIYWEEHSGFVYTINDLKYFETFLTKGEHKIRIEYLANVWTDLHQWVKNYSFRYSLSPAKFWKSFGTLEVTLNTSKFKNQFTTNLGPPTFNSSNSNFVWTFKKLPGNYLEVNYTPQLSSKAKMLLTIGTNNLTLFFALAVALVHIIFTRRFRKHNVHNKYSWVLIAGSIVVPFLVLFFNMYSYIIIDNAIGEEASRYHGYTFFIMVLYPIIMPVYWVLLWLSDKFHKKYLLKKQHLAKLNEPQV